MTTVIKLHSAPALIKNQSQVDAAAAAASTAAFNSVLASQGYTPGQAADPATAKAASDAAQAALHKAQQDAIAAGLSQVAGSGAPAPAAAASPVGAAAPPIAAASMVGVGEGPLLPAGAWQAWAAQHKTAVEFGVGLTVTALLAMFLVRAKHPAHP